MIQLDTNSEGTTMNMTYSEAAREWNEKTGWLTRTNGYIEELLTSEVTAPVEVHWEIRETAWDVVNAIMTIRNPDGESVDTLYPEVLGSPSWTRSMISRSLGRLLGMKVRRMLRELAASEVE